MISPSPGAPDAPATAAAAPHASLPVELSSFVGRARELAAARARFATTRCLTFTGAGGSGKTRLALELATREAASIELVAWVPLAPLAPGSDVAGAVLAALGATGQPGRSDEQVLAGLIGARRTLLVLDNCEHLVESCAALADALLRQCRGLKVLATSREALGIAGETAWLVPLLSLPGEGSIEDSEAVQLFVQRARSVSPGFTLSTDNAALVARIVRRLDGLPLAVELAAARLRSLPLAAMAQRLDEDFGLLSSRSRTAIPRHQTLRAAIHWSHRLLSAAEQRVLRRLAVFAGGFSLEAAETLAPAEGVDAAQVTDLVAGLVEKSLLTLVESPHGARYRLLEMIREFALEQLEASGEGADCEAAHARFFTGLAHEAAPHLTTAQRRTWTARLREDLDNLRAALEWARHHDAALHLDLAGSLCWFWYSAGLWPEGREQLAVALASDAAQVRGPARARALFASGALASLQGQPAAALPLLEESAVLAGSLGDEALRAYSLNYIGMALGQQLHPDCVAPTHAALDWARAAGDAYAERLALLILGTYELGRGDPAHARRYMEQAVAVARRFGQDRELGIALNCLAGCLIAAADDAGAEALLREALAVFAQDPQYLFIARSLEFLAAIACRQDRALAGARLLGKAAAVRDSVGSRPFANDEHVLAATTAAARQRCGDSAFERAFAEGRALSLEQALEVARPDPQHAAAPALPGGMPAAPVLRVRALGSFSARVDGQAPQETLLRHSKPRELLLYLLLHPDGGTREQIGLAIWPDSTDAQLRNSFHVALHHLRRALGGSHPVQFAAGRYRLAAEQVDFDVNAFDAAATAALAARGPAAVEPLRRAAAAYAGDIRLPEPAGDWLVELRDGLARRHLEVLAALGAALLQEGRHEEAVQPLQRACALDEVHETAARDLMIALARCGRAAEALVAAERLRVALKRELAVAPSPLTLQVGARIRRGDPV